MSKKISYMIADFLVQKNVVQKEKIEIYQYGYEALFFCIEETAMLIAIGFFLHSWIQTLVFIIVFVSLRQYTGGYHAKSCKFRMNGTPVTLQRCEGFASSVCQAFTPAC